MVDPRDSACKPSGQATHPGVRGFVRQGPTPRISNEASVRRHARACLNDAMRVNAAPSVARGKHSRRAAGTGAGACGLVPLGGIGATPGGDADDVSFTDMEKAPGTSSALRARRARTATRRLAMMADGGAGSVRDPRAGMTGGDGNVDGGTSGGGGARVAATTTSTGAAGGPATTLAPLRLAATTGVSFLGWGRRPRPSPKSNGGRPRAPRTIRECSERPPCARQGASPVRTRN